ncbi:MAG: HlyD family secretion protein [Gammaproteobacteria bacterium]|nr:HlyD family secretion protein [Gammaproteobacteria bacterium]
MQKKITRWIVAVILVIIAITIIESIYYRESFYPSSDDAYVNARYVEVASLLNGTVEKVLAKENQLVQKGQPVFILDKSQYELSLQAAEAKLMIAKQKAAAGKEAVASAKAQLQKSNIELDLLREDTKNTLTLVAKNDLSKYEASMAKSKLKAAESEHQAAQHKLSQIELESGNADAINPIVKGAEAEYQHALYELAHTSYVAPLTGVVTNIKLHEGDLVQVGQPLFVIIDPMHFWVEANFSEHKLIHLRENQPAQVHIDMYPNISFTGKLESISHGSSGSFSLLPAQNTTGSFIKVTQRFPIIISVNNPDYQKYPVRIGASCEVVVDTKSVQEGKVIAKSP